MNTNENAPESKLVTESNVATESNIAAGSNLTSELKNASELKLATESKVERESNLVTLSLEVAYNGAPFSGFARQPGQLTVQGSIEEALALIFRHPIETVCAGRTDSGVHAKGQVVSFCVTQEGRSQETHR